MISVEEYCCDILFGCRGDSVTAAVDAQYRYGYAFDDIGNRKTSAERGANCVYTANNLNQYTAVADGLTTNLPTSQLPNLPTFQPVYDADGNQTVVKTATGTWSVTYNGENRPVRWTKDNTVITMSYDRMGRRVTKNGQRFVYDGYLQIAEFTTAIPNSSFLLHNSYVWDPTEKIATRPLAWNSSTSQPSTSQLLFYTHDGNKNVSEVIAANGTLAAHYEYAPFGALTAQRGTSAAANPWRFSSEYAEDVTATFYYNYRHYEPLTGRWLQRDPIGEDGGMSEYAILANQVFSIDRLGFLDTSADSRGTPSATAKLGIPKDYGEFVLEVTPKNIQEGCELNFIQLVREYTFGVHPGWSEWMVDATRLSDQPPPLQPYYYDFSDSVEQSYLLSDGSVRFLDRPDIGTPMEFYLFIVQRCCLEYYGGSKDCKCCKKSRATVLGRVHWTTANNFDGEAVYVAPRILTKKDREGSYLRWLLKKYVNGQTFFVQGCQEFFENSSSHSNEMPVTVEMDYGDKL